jgi:hypothetical protein
MTDDWEPGWEADPNRVFRCDYCGTLTPLGQVTLYWVHAYTLDDGKELVTSGLYCCDPCGDMATSRAGTSRG